MAEEGLLYVSLHAAGAGTMEKGAQRQFLSQLRSDTSATGNSGGGDRYVEIPLEAQKAQLAAMGIEVVNG